MGYVLTDHARIIDGKMVEPGDEVTVEGEELDQLIADGAVTEAGEAPAEDDKRGAK